jgi:hypothetical protein
MTTNQLHMGVKTTEGSYVSNVSWTMDKVQHNIF